MRPLLAAIALVCGFAVALPADGRKFFDDDPVVAVKDTQDASRVRRVLRELRAAPDAGARAEELEQIQERLRKLSARLEELEARSRAQVDET